MRAAALSLFLLACSAPAEALLFRAYLAAGGSDANPCTLAQPCRLLPAALAAVADGGEIWMLDSANYNASQVNVGKSVTLLAVPGALGSVVAAGGNAISIATPGVEVVLRNLVIVPLPGSGGTNGVHMTAGAALTLESCLVANLPGSGVIVNTAASVRITGSTLRDNGEDGLLVTDGARVTVTRSHISGNGDSGAAAHGNAASSTTTIDLARSSLDGNGLAGFLAWSVDATAVVRASVRDSRIVRNGGNGIASQSDAGGAVSVSATRNLVSNNGGDGIGAYSAGAKVWANGNAVSHNAVGLRNSSAIFESACDNAVRDNTTNSTGTISGCATNYVFITSTTHTGNLGGTAGADAICQSRATAAGLPGTYVAWVSGTTSTAPARIGPSARGWQRLDGKPFADTLADLLAGRILYPNALTEAGASVASGTLLFTGTTASGSASADNCSSWTSTSGSGSVGEAAAGTQLWTQFSGTLCSTPTRLQCFGTSTSTVAFAPVTNARYAFVSSSGFAPGSGLAAADNACNTDAAAAGLPGTYRALLASTGATAASRLNTSPGTLPWKRVDNVLVWNAATDLASGSTSIAPLNVTAAGAYLGNFAIWLGAANPAVAGTVSTTCGGWINTAGDGITLRAAEPVPGPAFSSSCSASFVRLYCLQQ